MLECMEKQTYSKWELIIVDDGSTDESVPTVEDFSKKDKRIKLIKRPENRKKGGNTCRNIGLENAKGEYIIWFDADDLIAPYNLEQRVNFIQNHKDIDFAIFPAMAFKHEIGDTPMITGAKGTFNDYHNFLKNYVPFQVVTNLYKRKALIENDLKWDENLMGRQDPDFNISALKKNLSYKYSHLKPDYFWRILGNNQSVSKQLLTPQKLNINLYYLHKRISNDLNKSTKSSIQFLTLYILFPYLKAKRQNDVYKILNIIGDKIKVVNKEKIQYYFKLSNSWNSTIAIHLTLWALFPMPSMRLFFETKINNFKIKLLAKIYKKRFSVSEQVFLP